jgi:hypothetical protein
MALPTRLCALYNGFSEYLVPITAAGAADHPIAHATDGWLHTYFRWPTAGQDAWVQFSTGPGETVPFDTLIVADLARFTVGSKGFAVYGGPDGTTWTLVLAETVTPGHLRAPDFRHGIFQIGTTVHHRYYSLNTWGFTGSGDTVQYTEIWLGARFEFPTGVLYPARLGPRRAFRGMSVEVEWVTTDEANTGAIVDYLGAVSPDYPQEQPLETIGGNVLGARPHWLYDPAGAVFRHQNTPTPVLLPVLLMTPADVVDESLIRGLRRGVRATYRERR